MPYISEKIKLPSEFDRRRKLSDSQREEIKAKYANGISQRQLAREYNVNKGTIRNIVDIKAQEYYKRYVKEHWKKYQTYGEEHNAIAREHRAYKHQLFKNGKITREDKENGEDL